MKGPYPNGDQFIVHFTYDVTSKHTGKRMLMDEMGLYTVENGKFTKEEFRAPLKTPGFGHNDCGLWPISF